MKTLVLDIEANGLLMNATTVWCVVVQFDGTLHTLKPFEDEDSIQVLSDMFEEADRIVGHNIMMYDLPVLKRLYGISYNPNKVIDTMLVSRAICPDREGGHSLKVWGQRLGNSKAEFTDFSQYSEEMVEYCIQDVKVSTDLFNYFKGGIDSVTMLRKVKKGNTDVNIRKHLDIPFSLSDDYIKREHVYAYIISLQILAGFTLDIPKAEELRKILYAEYIVIYNEVKSKMSPKIDRTHYNIIKSKGGILDETPTTYTYESRGKVVVKEFRKVDPNPTSTEQLATYLKSLGWVPTKFTDKGNIQLDSEVLSTINIEGIDRIIRMYRLKKMLGMISDGDSGWLKCVNPLTGRVHGDVITNGTNTGRCTHSAPNMGQIDKKDLRMRSVWIAKDGWVLVDCDAASLESRVLAHYLAAYDNGEFADVATNGDLHTHNQTILGLNKRDSAKGILYALIYGAGDMKLGKLAMTDANRFTYNVEEQKSAGVSIRNQIADSLTGYADLIADIKKISKARGFLNGLDKRPLHPRKEYSALNLLIQSAGAIIMKQALVNSYMLLHTAGYKHGVDYNYVCNVHDEMVVECRPEIAEGVAEALKRSIVKAGEDFNFKCVLDADARIGNTWAEIH